ncbi:MAG: hypothetical protein L0219_03535 [Phycisphaerales bacterium]|nr:hypothetical protein [Phycisphaerales bacterium]
MSSATGGVPCYRIGTTQYLVCRHVCKSIVAVYKYGVAQGSGFTAGTITVQGRTMQVINFSVDPKDANRPNEIEITADVQGTTDDGTTSGNLITLPARQLENYLLKEAAVLTGELSAAHFTAAASAQTTDGYLGSAWIGDETPNHLEVIARFSTSFIMPFFLTRTGLFAVSQLTANGIFGLSGTFPSLTDQHDVLRESFRVLSNEEVASLLDYSYKRDWATQAWQTIDEQKNIKELVNLGGEIREPQEMYYVGDQATANRVAAVRLLVSAENQQFAEFDLPIEYHYLDLNDVVLVTHHLGLGPNGYVAAPFRLVSLEVTLQPTEARVRAIGARNVDDLAHCDSHADAHGDLAHSDLAHGDVSHGDVAHGDVAHSDISHADTHNDVAHEDSAHNDSHDDSHGDQAHSDHTDSFHHDHVDSAHLDHTDNFHQDSSHNDSHLDSHADVSHADSPHSDGHSDAAHSDSHTDSHTDSAHSDQGHGDSAHSDTVHNDYHCDTGLDHSDAHTDTAHSDTAHSDGHGDSAHSDTAHTDSHSDVAHSDVAHGDVAHSDLAHSDSHGDTAHSDFHDDEITHDDHADNGHFDNVGHIDAHGDAAHSDVAHSDVSHSDSPHTDQAHSDTHTDSHADVAHSDVAHSDTAHSDVAHVDVAHVDTHSDHGDVHHGDSP